MNPERPLDLAGDMNTAVVRLDDDEFRNKKKVRYKLFNCNIFDILRSKLIKSIDRDYGTVLRT